MKRYGFDYSGSEMTGYFAHAVEDDSGNYYLASEADAAIAQAYRDGVATNRFVEVAREYEEEAEKSEAALADARRIVAEYDRRHIELLAKVERLERATTQEWKPIATVPHDQYVILANFDQACLLSGAPHTWTASYVTKWSNLRTGEPVDAEPMWCEASHSATNSNGEPTHWTELPTPPQQPRDAA